MKKRIAIIDLIHQDIGLKILFPEADYYIIYDDLDKSQSLKKYNIQKRYDIENINDINYDYLFIIIALYDAIPGSDFYKQNIEIGFQKILEIIDKNNFKKVFLFDNYDYDYDPNEYLQNRKIDLYFKRNYNKKKRYNSNVIPFSFIMFGQYSMIELMDNKRMSNNNPENRLFFSGTLFNHIDDKLKYYRNRRILYEKIKYFIYNPGQLNFHDYMNTINNSKYCLDLNGVGDPNKRTFEILSQGSLRIAEYNDLQWCFGEDFCEETIFHDENDLRNKIELLITNNELYNKCLSRQNELISKYFNVEWIRNYIEDFILK
jgi:hypothetical protein